MKVSVSQQQLAHGLNMVSRAVAPRSTLPVLANVLIATDEGRLRLSATNLELGISCWLGAKISEEGSVTIPSRTLSDLVNTFPNDTVTLTLNVKNQTLNVQCGSNSTDIKGIDAQEFPPMPVTDLSNGIVLNMADFKEMIQQVVFAASSDDARPVLQGVNVMVGGSQMTLAATDGFRISIRKAVLENTDSKPLSLIIPARALSELGRIGADGEQMLTMSVPSGRGQVIFNLKDVELVSQLIEGNFPDCNAIIPKNAKTHTVLPTQNFLKACKQAEIIAREGTNVIRLNLLPGTEDKPGQVEISAHSEETGSSEVFVDATIDGPGLVIAFNVRFMREALEIVKTPNVILETNANNTPGTLRAAGDDNFTHVIMPMHLG